MKKDFCIVKLPLIHCNKPKNFNMGFRFFEKYSERTSEHE
jgi:hypothetical protein